MKIRLSDLMGHEKELLAGITNALEFSDGAKITVRGDGKFVEHSADPAQLQQLRNCCAEEGYAMNVISAISNDNNIDDCNIYDLKRRGYEITFRKKEGG